MSLTASEAARVLSENHTPKEAVKARDKAVGNVLGTGDHGYTWWEHHELLQERMGSLNAINRGKLLDAFGGPLRPVLEAAIKSARDLPYQTHSTRVPFRTKSVKDAESRIAARVASCSLSAIREYEQPIEWFAEYCGYISDYWVSGTLDVLLTCAINAGNKVVLETLIDSCQGTHPVGIVSVSAIRALLRCEDSRAWSTVEKLLLNAHGNEGLRQAIVECADELSPISYQRVVRCIIEHNLLRFSSVMRAFLLWFPGLIDEKRTASAEKTLMRLMEFMDSSSLDPEPTYEDTYLRLWADAYFEADDAIRRGILLMRSPNVDVRRAVANIAGDILLTTAFPLIELILQDPDLRVVSRGLTNIKVWNVKHTRVFHSLVLDCARKWPEKGGEDILFDRRAVWDMALHLANAKQLPEYVDRLCNLSADGRLEFAHRLDEIRDSRLKRTLVLRFIGDNSEAVRASAFRKLSQLDLSGDDAIELETLLTRKAADLRTGILNALEKQKNPLALQSAARLASSSNRMQVQAGHELADVLLRRGVKSAGKLLPEAGSRVDANENPANFFGLIDVPSLTWGAKPAKGTSWDLETPGAVQLVQALDEYIHSRRNDAVLTADYNPQEVPVGSLTLRQVVGWDRRQDFDSDDDRGYCAIVDDSLQFLKESGDWDVLDSDDLFRATLIIELCDEDRYNDETDKEPTIDVDKLSIRYTGALQGILRVFQGIKSASPEIAIRYLSNYLALYEQNDYQFVKRYYSEGESSWRTTQLLSLLVTRLYVLAIAHGDAFTTEQWAQVWSIYKFIDEPLGEKARNEVNAAHSAIHGNRKAWYTVYNADHEARTRLKVPYRNPIPLPIVSRCYAAGVINDSDAFDQLRWHLSESTHADRNVIEPVRLLVQKIVAKIVEIESKRGDLSTPVSSLAADIRGFVHLPQVLDLLATGVPLSRGYCAWSASSASKGQMFTHLLSHSRPAPNETNEVCAKAFRELKIKPDRLIELAMLAPHWAPAIEAALVWNGLEDAVWWLHAHTKDASSGASAELAQLWQGEIAKRTPLTLGQLEGGYCDAVWYARVRQGLDHSHWAVLLKCAKFASSGLGHTRAKLFAQALDGEIRVDDLIHDIHLKRNPNQVRALGLCPLSSDPQHDVQVRYLALQQFKLGSRAFGAQKRETEKLAVEVALDNLARLAGYPDALRLSWSLESELVKDLDGEGVVVQEGDFTVRLYYDLLGQAQIEVRKGGEIRKDAPAPIRKVPQIKALFERRTALKKQLSRMRLSLEQAMQRGDAFSGAELSGLLGHPGLRPLLNNLVFVGQDGVVDFPERLESVGWECDAMRIAHPYDLLTLGVWPEFQSRVFREERVQPFKQVFRELYVLTESERTQTALTRYGGHQVRPRQAAAILGKRGWTLTYEEGVCKTDHQLGITAQLFIENLSFTPGDIEGATIDELVFTKSRTYERVPLIEVPPLLLSETLRDLDLIVSVASMVGVDPESSESTVEMRRSIVEQTSMLLGFANVQFEARHALIQGKLAEYSVHLGSATVHQVARGELVILAVRQPQRGRIFLPFVDDDPRTAEVVSKVILLARDDEIKDPSILRQIVGVK